MSVRKQEPELRKFLIQGNNVIRATAIASDGGPNVDYLKVFSANAFQPVSEEKITIYIAGDSTVQTYNASYAPQAGWGQFLGQYFTSNVVIETGQLREEVPEALWKKEDWTAF